jgi:hypothetical protein
LQPSFLKKMLRWMISINYKAIPRQKERPILRLHKLQFPRILLRLRSCKSRASTRTRLAPTQKSLKSTRLQYRNSLGKNGSQPRNNFKPTVLAIHCSRPVRSQLNYLRSTLVKTTNEEAVALSTKERWTRRRLGGLHSAKRPHCRL